MHLCLQTIAMRPCQEKVVHMLLLGVRFAILNIDDYFALVGFQMDRLTLQTIVMRQYQEKVVHMMLIVVWFVVFDANDYFALVAFQMAWLTLYVVWHVVLSTSGCDVHVKILTCLD